MGLAASAIILAGGRSARMGQSKAALDFAGRPLIQIVVEELKRRFDEIVIVAAPPEFEQSGIDAYGVTIIHDAVAFAGPLDALRRGLDAIATDRAFACACDLPLLSADLAALLVGMLEGFDAVIPEVGGKLQPLHAAYHKRCAGPIAALVARGEQRLSAIADAVNVKRVTARELRASDPDLRSFLNVNTPEDYARALALLNES